MAYYHFGSDSEYHKLLASVRADARLNSLAYAGAAVQWLQLGRDSALRSEKIVGSVIGLHAKAEYQTVSFAKFTYSNYFVLRLSNQSCVVSLALLLYTCSPSVLALPRSVLFYVCSPVCICFLSRIS